MLEEVLEKANKKLDDGLEQVRCAIVNLDNLKRVMPSAGANPFFKIVQHQLETAELILAD